MPTRKIAIRMTSAPISTAQAAVQGMLIFPFFSIDNCVAANKASDPNCGAAFNAAVDDTAFGSINGCGRTNPSNAVVKPSGQPVCN